MTKSVKGGVNPWLKFYPSDWRADPALRMCSLAARGLWIEILCVMHEATPRGSLRINGKPITNRQIASLAGCEKVDELLQELEDAGVFSRDADGSIVSRRMTRDAQKEEKDKANGRKGGNPTLSRGVNPGGAPQDNGEDKAQKPEARSHISSLRSDKESGRASRLKADWTLPDEWRQDAIDEGIPAERIDVEARTMRDWSLGAEKGARKDWRAVWRNWCRRVAKDLSKSKPVAASQRRTAHAVMSDLARRMQDAEQDRSDHSNRPLALGLSADE